MARFNGWRLTRAGFVFIIVALLLAVAVFAGVQFVQRRGEQVREAEAAEIARQNQAEATPAIAEATPAAEDSHDEQQATNTAPSQSDAGPEALPQTGIESILPILLLGGVTYGAVRGVRSRFVLA